MFTKSARYYDAIYAALGKDYPVEAQKIHALVKQHRKSTGNALLEVACGTGHHAFYLSKDYKVEGLDLDEEILSVARQNYPHIRFHHGDMLDFDLGRKFDAITCLFSSIGYVKIRPRLEQAIHNMSRHLVPGGVLCVEPWFSPDEWNVGRLSATYVDQPELKICRMNIAGIKDQVSLLNFHYLIGTPQGIDYFTEMHELGLFTHADYLAAFTSAGMEVVHDPEGIYGRGLYIGIQPMQ